MRLSTQLRLLAALFACVGLGWSALYLRPPDGVSFELTCRFDVVVVAFILAPLALAVLALVGVAFTGVTRVALWVNSAAWLLLGGGELLEGPPFLPSIAPLVGVVVLAVTSVGVLLRGSAKRAV